MFTYINNFFRSMKALKKMKVCVIDDHCIVTSKSEEQMKIDCEKIKMERHEKFLTKLKLNIFSCKSLIEISRNEGTEYLYRKHLVDMLHTGYFELTMNHSTRIFSARRIYKDEETGWDHARSVGVGCSPESAINDLLSKI